MTKTLTTMIVVISIFLNSRLYTGFEFGILVIGICLGFGICYLRFIRVRAMAKSKSTNTFNGLPWPKLIPGTLIKRYKRFLADVKLKNDTVVTAHCPNTGSMQGCSEPGRPVYLSFHDNPKRKLKYTCFILFKEWMPRFSNRPTILILNTAKGCGVLPTVVLKYWSMTSPLT